MSIYKRTALQQIVVNIMKEWAEDTLQDGDITEAERQGYIDMVDVIEEWDDGLHAIIDRHFTTPMPTEMA